MYSGCELIWAQTNHGCYVHTDVVSRGNRVANHFCWIGEVDTPPAQIVERGYNGIEIEIEDEDVVV